MPVVYDRIVKKPARRSLKFNPMPYIFTAIPPAILIAIYFIFRSDKKFAGAVSEGFAKPVRSFLGLLCSNVRISITELLYIAVGLFIVFFIFDSIIKIIRSKPHWQMLLRRVLVVCLIILYYQASFYFLWGFDCYAPNFADKAGISPEEFSTEDLIKVTTYFVNQASTLSSTVSRDSYGDFVVSPTYIINSYSGLYDEMQSEFSCLSGTVYRPKPMMLFSQIMSRTGFTGIYVAYTGESNININAPAFTVPCTVAHELAHQLGVCAEDEANFVGMLACTKSHNDSYAYSGYFGATIHLMNALYQVDQEAWNKLYKSFSENLLHDWDYNNAYWSSMKSQISETASDIYDKYLKSNGQTQGIVSYSQCVRLLVNYFADNYIS